MQHVQDIPQSTVSSDYLYNFYVLFLTQHLFLAPIIDEKIISYDTVTFDGRFENENVFHQSAGSEVDAEWKSLGVECEFNVFTNVSKPGVICRILTDLSGF